MSKELKKKVKHGLYWNFINQIGNQVIFLAFSVYLARLLSPSAFGVIGLVTIFSNFAALFIDFGFGAALVRRKDVTQTDLSTVFWVNLGVGLLLYILFFVSAGLIASFYNREELKPLVRVVTLSFIFSALTSVQSSILTKRLDFKRKTIISFISLAIGYTVAFYFAFKNYGYWSLVYQTITSSLVSLAILWFQSSWRPSFVFSLKALKQMFGFGMGVVADNAFTYWTRNADNFLIGKILGSASLGVYTRAYSLMMLPLKNISSVITKVMFPAFSAYQDNIPEVQKMYLKTTRLIAFITFPMMIGLAIVAEPFIFTFYGHKWAEVIPILQILSVLGAFQSILTLNGSIYNSMGKSVLAFKVSSILSLLLIIGFLVGLKLNGLLGLTWAYFIIAGLGSLPILSKALELISLSLKEIYNNMRAIVIATFIMGIFLLFLNLLINFKYPLKLFIEIIAGAVIYFFMIKIFQPSLLVEVLNISGSNKLKSFFTKKVKVTV